MGQKVSDLNGCEFEIWHEDDAKKFEENLKEFIIENPQLLEIHYYSNSLGKLRGWMKIAIGDVLPHISAPSGGYYKTYLYESRPDAWSKIIQEVSQASGSIHLICDKKEF